MEEPVVNRMFGMNFYDPRDYRALAIYEPVSKWLCPPGRDLKHFEWELMVNIPKQGSDGRSCKIYEMRCPSRFFKLVAETSSNRKGEPKVAWEMSSGSGDEMGALIVRLALAVSEGMLDARML
jgi:hypothetical protein